MYPTGEIKIIGCEEKFFIILPVGCNANCSFCSWRDNSFYHRNINVDEFMLSLKNTLIKLPTNIDEIVITGGEPTIFTRLEEICNIINLYKSPSIKKITLTTNGSKLSKVFDKDWFINTFTNVNISRHHYDDFKNNIIFKMKTVNYENIKNITKFLSNHNVVVNLVCVVSSMNIIEINNLFVETFIKFATEIEVNGLIFRKDFNDLGTINFMSGILNSLNISKKIDIFVDYSLELNSNYKNIILHPNGKVSTNWLGTNLLNFE